MIVKLDRYIDDDKADSVMGFTERRAPFWMWMGRKTAGLHVGDYEVAEVPGWGTVIRQFGTTVHCSEFSENVYNDLLENTPDSAFGVLWDWLKKQ